MHTLVVYESMFGNTEAIAKAVAEGVASQVPVELVEIGAAPATLPEQVGLLIVGAPTHAFGMSRPATRKAATDQGAPATEPHRVGLREWLERVTLARGLPAAAFDTRIKKRFVPGSAAQSAGRRLRRHGCRLIAPPRSFWVSDTAGPLLGGELERAGQWGAAVAAEIADHPATPAGG